MSNFTATAQSFFDACETGKAWAGCQQYCTPDATFSSQADPLVNITTLSAYCDWMRDLLTVLSNVNYEIKSFGTDTTRHNVAAFGVFTGTHFVDGVPSPNGKKVVADYVYVMQFTNDKISHMTKIWHSK
jgi:ketosteroid isomerase-like protein